MSTEIAGTAVAPFKSQRKTTKKSKKALSATGAGAESFEDANQQTFEDACSEGMVSPTAEDGVSAFGKGKAGAEEEDAKSGTILAHTPAGAINSPRAAGKASIDLPAPPAPVAAPQNTVTPPTSGKLPDVKADERPFSPKRGFLASMKNGAEGTDGSRFGTPKTAMTGGATPGSSATRSTARFGSFLVKQGSASIARTPSGISRYGSMDVKAGGSSQASHAWHDLSPGPDAPELINVVIETPAGSKVKYALDPDTGMMMVDRVLHSSMLFPANYGFVPQSLAIDNQIPMEVLLLNQKPCTPLSYVHARPVGVLALRDGEGKVVRKVVLAVHHDDPVFAEVTDLSGLSDHRLEEIKIFFQDSEWYGEEDHVRMSGEYNGADTAKHYTEQSCRRYINVYSAGANAVPLDEEVDKIIKPPSAAQKPSPAEVAAAQKQGARKAGFFSRMFACGAPSPAEA